jgi:hypothetical protein
MSSASALFAFDYVDPLSYLVHRVLEDESVAAATPEITLAAAEVRPPPEPFLSPDDPEFLERWAVVRKEAPAHIAENPPFIVPWTRKAHELRKLAESKGVGREVHGAIFRAFFEDGEDIGRVDVLVRIAMDAGMDYSETKAVLDVDKFAAAVEEEGRSVRDRGVPTPPALFVGIRTLEGWEGREALLQCLTGPHEDRDQTNRIFTGNH